MLGYGQNTDALGQNSPWDHGEANAMRSTYIAAHVSHHRHVAIHEGSGTKPYFNPA